MTLRQDARGALKQGTQRILGRLGYRVVRVPLGSATGEGAESESVPPDFDAEAASIVQAVRSHTLTPPERIYMLCEAVRYVVRAGVPGSFVECGVWRGGSSLAMVRTLLSLERRDRDIYMFDTFERMPDPGPEDVDIMGVPAAHYHAILESGGEYDHRYDFLPFEDVKASFRALAYPSARLHFVKGLVEETIPEQAPDSIALLRLDTDYYQSTRHELEHLFDRISPGGVLLIDDYGHFHGCRQATDELVSELASQGRHLLLNRIDYSARIAVVPPGSAPTRPGFTPG
jgi:O-methyltransferase